MKYFLTWLLFLLSVASGYSQVVINLQLPPAGLTVKEQLWNLSLVNSSEQPLQVQLEMQLTEVSTNQRILTAVSRDFILPKGVKQVRAADVGPIIYNVVNPSYAVDANPNGLLPIGVFNICFTLISAGVHGERMGDECETIEVEPLSPPSLVLPSDQEQLELSRPQFTWMPPAPLNLFSRLSYDLIVVEVLPTQSPSDAIIQNIPVLLLPDINFTSVQYPHTLTELDTVKTYAWRIKAKNNGLHVANSEIWTFTINKEPLENKIAQKRFNFTRLSRVQDASFTTCDGRLYIEYINELNDTAVSINIFDVTKARRIPVHLDDRIIPVKYGVNFQTIDLTDNPGIQNHHMYLLELINAKEERWYMKFQFSKP